MHCELVIPALLGAAVEVRLPALEILLARGRRTMGEARTFEAWLSGGFGLKGPAMPAGALTLLAHGGAPAGSLLARADPVHLRLLRDRAIVVPAAAFSLSEDEARALCESINAHFGARFSLTMCSADSWVATLAAPLPLPATPALSAAGQDVPAGTPADALITELQMVLHEHPVNEAREARGEPTVNSLWLWGAGSLPAPARSPWRSVTADDLLIAGLARAAQAEVRAAVPGAEPWLQRMPQDGRHLVVLDQLRAPLALADPAARKVALQSIERAWLAPVLAALRGSRVGMVTLHVPDAGISAETVRGDLRRVWKRPRPLNAWMR